MKITNVINPQWANAEHTMINLVVTHSAFGDIPFSASPNDPEPYGRALFTSAVAGEFGPIAEYIPPVVPVVVPQEISKAQGIAILMDNGYWQEVNTYFTTQAPPETLTLFNAVTVFNRASPLLLQMQTMLGITDAEVDQMFIDGAKKVL